MEAQLCPYSPNQFGTKLIELNKHIKSGVNINFKPSRLTPDQNSIMAMDEKDYSNVFIWKAKKIERVKQDKFVKNNAGSAPIYININGKKKNEFDIFYGCDGLKKMNDAIEAQEELYAAEYIKLKPEIETGKAQMPKKIFGKSSNCVV